MRSEGVLALMEDVLLKRLASADPCAAEEALSQLYERHAMAVHVFAARALQDASVALLVVEEVFVDLYRRGDGLDLGQESVRAFLVKQAHRRCVELEARPRSSASRRPRLSQPVHERNLTVGVTTPPAVLRPEERVALDLAWLGEMTCAEVAAFLDVPERTIRVRMRDGLRRVSGLSE